MPLSRLLSQVKNQTIGGSSWCSLGCLLDVWRLLVDELGAWTTCSFVDTVHFANSSILDSQAEVVLLKHVTAPKTAGNCGVTSAPLSCVGLSIADGSSLFLCRTARGR